MGKKTEGSITVFLSLILLLIMSLLITMIEGARVNAAKICAERSLSTALDSTLAEFYGPLWKEYHLFGLYTEGENKGDQREEIEGKISDYISYTLDPNKGLHNLEGIKYWDLYDIKLNSIAVKDETMLMDYQGKLLINEAVEYMKYKEMGSLVEHFLNKLSLIETPEKVSYIYEEKQKVEGELVEIDKGILKLMKLLDGLLTSDKGIEVTKKGELKTTEYFVKKISLGQVTKEEVGINQDTIYQALKNSYINPIIKFNLLLESSTSLEGVCKQLSGNLAYRLIATNELSARQDELEELNAIDKKTKEDVRQIKELQKTIDTIVKRIKDYDNEGEQLRSKKESLGREIESTKGELFQLIEGIEPKITEAINVIDHIILKTQVAKPLLNQYEELLKNEKASISEDIYRELEENLNEMKRYISVDDSGYNFTQMKEILKANRKVLINCEEFLAIGEAQLYKEDYQGSKASFGEAEREMKQYRIKGLTIDYSTLVLDKSDQENPISKAGNLLQSGIASLVMDPNLISHKELPQGTLPSDIAAMSQEETNLILKLEGFLKNTFLGKDNSSMGELFQSFGSISKVRTMAEEGINKLAEHLLYQEYLKEHFALYMPKEEAEENKPSALSYEQEYLLIGQTSDQGNLSSVISRILFIRTILDFVSILGDGAKLQQAKATAAALVGFTGLPILISITQAVILILWSLAEALLDVSALMMGKEVPIMKKKVVLELPDLFVINRTFLQSKASSVVNSNELSFSYQDYLRMFLLMKSKEDIAYKSLDLMQENIKLRYNNNSFHIDHCLFGYVATAEYMIEPKFINISYFKKFLNINPKGYPYSTELSYSY